MAEESIPMWSRPNEDYDKVEQSGKSVKGCAKKQKDWNVDTDIDLFLLGKTGNGKSATGNSILLREEFESSASTTSVTTKVNFDFTEFNGRVIKVVDVRGVEDTRMTMEQSKALFIHEMEYAVVANPKGYHAFLIVLKYGNRFTAEDVNTINFLKDVFGETFVKDHCIIIMTGGDSFFLQEGLTFKNWCDKQQGSFTELLQECSHRIVLFNNRSKDLNEQKKQVIELLKLVDQLKGTRYTDDKFKKANLTQTELIMKSEVEDLPENALKETSLILEKLKSCQESPSDEQEALPNLIDRTEVLMEDLLGLDKKTKLHQILIETITEIKSNISLEVKINVDVDFTETPFFDEITERREELKLRRRKLEARYKKYKLKYILTSVGKLCIIIRLNNFFSKVFNTFSGNRST